MVAEVHEDVYLRPPVKRVTVPDVHGAYKSTLRITTRTCDRDSLVLILQIPVLHVVAHERFGYGGALQPFLPDKLVSLDVAVLLVILGDEVTPGHDVDDALDPVRELLGTSEKLREGFYRGTYVGVVRTVIGRVTCHNFYRLTR